MITLRTSALWITALTSPALAAPTYTPITGTASSDVGLASLPADKQLLDHQFGQINSMQSAPFADALFNQGNLVVTAQLSLSEDTIQAAFEVSAPWVKRAFVGNVHDQVQIVFDIAVDSIAVYSSTGDPNVLLIPPPGSPLPQNAMQNGKSFVLAAGEYNLTIAADNPQIGPSADYLTSASLTIVPEPSSLVFLAALILSHRQNARRFRMLA